MAKNAKKVADKVAETTVSENVKTVTVEAVEAETVENKDFYLRIRLFETIGDNSKKLFETVMTENQVDNGYRKGFKDLFSRINFLTKSPTLKFREDFKLSLEFGFTGEEKTFSFKNGKIGREYNAIIQYLIIDDAMERGDTGNMALSSNYLTKKLADAVLSKAMVKPNYLTALDGLEKFQTTKKVDSKIVEILLLG